MEHLPSQMDFPSTVFRVGRPVYIKIADLLVSYAGSVIASIAIASTLSMGDLLNLGANLEILSDNVAVMLKRFPPILAAAGLLASPAGLLSIPRVDRIVLPTVLFLVASFVGILLCDLHNHLFWALLSGASGAILLAIGIRFLGGLDPIRRLFRAILSVAAVSLAALIANRLAGGYGIGVAAIGMTAVAGITLLRKELHSTTVAIGSSALTAVALFLATHQTVNADLSRMGLASPLLTIADAKTAVSLAIGLLFPIGIGTLGRFLGSKISLIASGLIGVGLPFAIGILMSPASLGMTLAGSIAAGSLLALILTEKDEILIAVKLMGIVSLLIIPVLVK